MSRASPTFKLVLLGDGRVGKTSMTLRFVNNVFSDKQTATIQASYLTKRVTVDNQMVTLAVWDTAGQERFHALGPIYYRDADAALLVYDIMDKDSFNRVKSWVKELRKMANKNIVMAIAGNKSDMDKLRKVDLQDSESYAESIGARHFLTSAKMNTGIEETFLDITRRLLEKRKSENVESASTVPHRKTLVIIDDPNLAGVILSTHEAVTCYSVRLLKYQEITASSFMIPIIDNVVSNLKIRSPKSAVPAFVPTFARWCLLTKSGQWDIEWEIEDFGRGDGQ